jgi:hypothetical protein
MDGAEARAPHAANGCADPVYLSTDNVCDSSDILGVGTTDARGSVTALLTYSKTLNTDCSRRLIRERNYVIVRSDSAHHVRRIVLR